MSGSKTVGKVKQAYSSDGERAGRQDHHWQDKADSSTNFLDECQLEISRGMIWTSRNSA